MRASDFDFALPEASIARYPLPRRDGSRLMRLDRATGAIRHHRFDALDGLLAPGDLLVVNQSRVLKARVRARKPSGGKVDLLFVAPEGEHWRAMATNARGLRAGLALTVGDRRLIVVDNEGEGFVRLALPCDIETLVAEHGAVPLPPYLGRPAEADDEARYQTVYARVDQARSVAAPTAGLHFTEDLLARLEARGVGRAAIDLEVGPGTFLPLRSDEVDEHELHAERFEISDATVAAIRAARRVVAVGTTVVRTLESRPTLAAGPGSTRLFIRPGFAFAHVGALITNFHLPRSTLLMLVAAFAGRERILAAYEEAVREGYRFFSYGDAMLIE